MPSILDRVSHAAAVVDFYKKHKPAKDQGDLFRWITIHSGDEGGGTHVQVEKSTGDIVKGPAALKAKGITNMDDFGKKSEPKSEPKLKAAVGGRFHAKGNEVHDASGRQASFRSPEKAQEAADRWNAEGKPGEQAEEFKAAPSIADRVAIAAGKINEPAVEPEPEDDFESFKAKYLDHFKNANKYSPNEVGSRTFTDKMAEMSDAQPDWVGKIEAEGEQTPDGSVHFDESTRSPHLVLADRLASKLKNGDVITKKDLFGAANEAHGGKRAEGAFGQSEAYDSLEAAINQSLDGTTDPRAGLDDAKAQVDKMAAQVDQLPTQTNRDGNKDDFQQFSTPPHYAFAVNWAANIKPGDVVLEPSAGTGSLAIHAKNAGGDVYTNELDPRRADFLKDQFGDDHVTIENAEQIAGILPGRGVPSPDVVVMNPPFSQTAGRMGDKKEVMTGAKHIAEAGLMLKPGGRLVSIVGGGMSPESKRYAGWFAEMKRDGFDLRANVLVDGSVYKKYGTQFDSRVLVFDKREPTGQAPVVGSVDNIHDLMTKLEGVRDDRQRTANAPGESDGVASAEGNGGIPESRGDADAAVGASVLGDAAGRLEGVSAGSEAAGLQSHNGTVGLDGESADAGPGTIADRPAGESDSGGSPVTGGTRRSKSLDERIKRAERGSKVVSGQPVQQPASSAPQLRPAEPVKLEPVTSKTSGNGDLGDVESGKPATQSDLGASLYDRYTPQTMRVAGAKPHPTALVESSAMAGVKPPVPTYSPMLSPDVIEKGMLSDAALESVVYAGQAHQQMLEAAEGEEPARRGYFIGDGTGGGKGRQLAGVILDNFNQGRKKAVWVTKGQNLLEDAKRDWRDVGMDPETMIHFDKIRKGAKVPDEGVAFITYPTLGKSPSDVSKKKNIDVLVDWLGPDFDGVVAFDEAHMMSNATNTEGARGTKHASQRALAGIELQKRLPKARVVYASATGATEVSNLAYADRLGIWGRGTPFPDKHDFIEKMENGGVAAMESVAQSLKATGSYAARSLSLDDGTPKGRVEYSRLTHSLDPDQVEQYDGMADGWQAVLQNIDKALEATGGNKCAASKSAASSQLWGAQQRFFNQVMTSMQTPAVIKSMEDDIANGRAPVVQLVNTMEAATKRGIAKQQEGDEPEDIDVSPREVLMQYLEKSFPIHRHEEYLSDDGKTVLSRPVMQDKRGADGKVMLGGDGKPLKEPVEDPRAVKMRDDLLDMAGTLRIPESPLDMIINHFGHEHVAEATGRSERIIAMDQDDGTRKKVIHRRNPLAANQSEAAAFQSGRKKILIFSDAGGTGRSYHADRNAENQDRRVHYMLQPGWRADAAVQGLGRTHRTNQSSAPEYKLVEIDQLKGQKRFISTIARRLDQLGAITKGQRQTGGGGLFSAADNLESKEASAALGKFFHNLEVGSIEGLDHHDVMTQMGLSKPDPENGGRRKKMQNPPEMGQFLNRMLSMRVGMQGKVFEAFDQHLKQEVEKAVEEGTLDTGVENYPASSINRKSDTIVHRDPKSGAEARLIVANVKNKSFRRTFEDVANKKTALKYVRNKQSGRVWGVYKGLDSTDPKTGRVTETYVLHGPAGKQYRTKDDVDGPKYSSWNAKFSDLDMPEAKRLWDAEHADIPAETSQDEHFLTGALLPIWDRIPGDKPKVYRMRMEDGQMVVGRHIPSKAVPEMMKRLGVAAEGAESHTAEGVHGKLSAGKHTATLANGWKLKPVMIDGERRIELTTPGAFMPSHIRELEADGVNKVRVGGYNTRFFVPTGATGAKVMERITKSRPITDVDPIATKYSRIEAAAGRYAKMHDVSGEARGNDGKWTGGSSGGLFDEKPAKEPWQMSRVEHLKSLGHDLDRLKDSKGIPRHLAADAFHKTEVADAIARGKDVPSNVLAEYPGLVPQKPARAVQTGLFSKDDLAQTGQTYLFDAGKPAIPEKRSRAKQSSMFDTGPSKLEAIESELTKKSRESAPLPQQKSMFARIQHAANVHKYGWVTIGGHPGPNGKKHSGGTPVDLDGQGNIVKGPQALKGSNVKAIPRKPPQAPAWFKRKVPVVPGVPPRQPNEPEKGWLKRIAPGLPAPAELPEKHDTYFNTDKAHAVVPMSQLRSTKSEEENQKGGGNAPKFMDLSAKGLTGKRDPITVKPNENGGYDVVDGNGTFTGATAHNWQNMPVQIEGKDPVGGSATKSFFNPSERESATRQQPIPPKAGYHVLAEHGSEANMQLQQFLDFGKGIGSQLGYTTILPGSMSEEQIEQRLEQPGGVVMLAPVKGEKRSAEKVASDYKGDWSRLLDIARATIAVDTVEQVHQVLDKMREAGIEFAKPPKDRMSKPADETGYRDILTNIVMPNGIVAELQIHLKPVLVAKKAGHHQYETMRSIDSRTKIENRQRTPEESAAYAQALQESQQIYGDAWKRASSSSNNEVQDRVARAAARYAKRHEDAPGQRDLFTGQTRSPERKQGQLRWITLHASSGEGTTHVQVNGDGAIAAGPKGLVGRSMGNLSGDQKKSRPTGGYVAKGNEVHDSNGNRHASFRNEEKARTAAEEWNQNGKPGETAPAAMQTAPAPAPVPSADKPANSHAAKHHPARSIGKKPDDLKRTEDGRMVGPTIRSIDDLHVDPQRFQYKVSGIDHTTGTNAELKKVKEFNPMLGGQILVWHDPADGKTYVVNGHHRAELASRSPRSNEVGKFNGRMPVYYVDAKTHQEARAHGALANIAEGRGTATDAARFMRDRGVGLEDFAKVGVSPSGSVAKAALELKKLSPTLFQKLSNGAITESRAQAIAKYLPDHDAQDQLFKYIEKHEDADPQSRKHWSDGKVSEMARATAARVKPAESSGGKKGGMFDDEWETLPIEQRADIADHVRRELSSEHRLFKDASSAKRQGKLESASDENKLDVQGNRERANAAESNKEEFDHRANAANHPVAMALDQFAERLMNEPRKRASILKEALAHIRGLTSPAGGDGKADDEGGKGSSLQPLQETGGRGSDREHAIHGGGTVSRFSRIAERIMMASARYSRR